VAAKLFLALLYLFLTRIELQRLATTMAPSAVVVEVAETGLLALPISANAKGTIFANGDTIASNGDHRGAQKRPNFLLDRQLHKEYPVVIGGSVNYLYTGDGRQVFDACGGAAVSCLGHGNERVIEAVCAQMKTGVPYLASMMWGNKVVDDLCQELISGTRGKMSRVYLTGSGECLNQLPIAMFLNDIRF